ncbi:hypothetical protein E2C01_038712 [Portunus trituberculatus]|uniref:Uncharacterized protein n=1 Tax=Portunus trituberculatus TaxID=210409 RepID=A0A5B7FIP7_PORTR|nr:hypothetical protein [Portunus trituberculatus]
MNTTLVECRSVRSRLRWKPCEFPLGEEGRLSEIRGRRRADRQEKEGLEAMSLYWFVRQVPHR